MKNKISFKDKYLMGAPWAFAVRSVRTWADLKLTHSMYPSVFTEKVSLLGTVCWRTQFKETRRVRL